MAFLLGPGSHEITPIAGVEGPGVSLLPMGGRVRDVVTEVRVMMVRCIDIICVLSVCVVCLYI